MRVNVLLDFKYRHELEKSQSERVYLRSLVFPTIEIGTKILNYLEKIIF